MGGLLGENGAGAVIDLVAFFDSDVMSEVWVVLELGAMVSIGTSRDGGAVMISVVDNGEWEKEYFRHVGEAVSWLQRVSQALRDRGHVARSDGGPVPQKARRTRSRLS